MTHRIEHRLCQQIWESLVDKFPVAKWVTGQEVTAFLKSLDTGQTYFTKRDAWYVCRDYGLQTRQMERQGNSWRWAPAEGAP